VPRLRTIALFLLLGAVVNVGVGWGCAWFVDVYEAPQERAKSFEIGHRWFVLRWRRAGADRVTSIQSSSAHAPATATPPELLVPSWNPIFIVSHKLDGVSGPSEGRRLQDGRGWPMLSLYGEGTFYAHGRATRAETLRGGFLYRGQNRSGQEGRFLPLLPIWPGFVINTLFYGVVIWTPCGLFAMRRQISVGLDRCRKYPYPLDAKRGAERPVSPGTWLSAGAEDERLARLQRSYHRGRVGSVPFAAMSALSLPFQFGHQSFLYLVIGFVWLGVWLLAIRYATVRLRQIRVARALLEPRCPACGYVVRGLPSSVCPECGADLPPRRVRA